MFPVAALCDHIIVAGRFTGDNSAGMTASLLVSHSETLQVPSLCLDAMLPSMPTTPGPTSPLNDDEVIGIQKMKKNWAQIS
jgi:hypothetical protein